MRVGAALLALAAAAASAAPAQAAPQFQRVDGSYDTPIYVTAPPRDVTRIFVVEQGGLVKVVENGALKAQPFANLTDALELDDERGLLSIAFPPDYESSGLVYAYLTARDSGELQVIELRRSATDPNRTDGSRRIVWRQAHDDAGNHNGGTIQFGPDGMLWIAPGDGGGSNDEFDNAQVLESQLGKLLRIDPRPSPGGSYTVPPGNPYSGAAETVWARGLRNPFRFSFDRGTGDLVIGDVGQGSREEIDWVRWEEGLGREGNFGWACFEGNLTGPKSCPPLAGYIAPVFDYERPAPRAVAGGVVVRDPGLPTMVGRYLYADTYVGEVRSLALGRPATGDRGEGLPLRPALVAFGEDACGHVYVVSLVGSVDRIQDGAPGACVLKPETPAAGGQPAPVPPAGPAAVPDTRRPSLRVTVTGRRSLVTRRRLRIALRSDEAATATVTGRLRGVARYRTARLRLAAGRRTVVNLRISRRTARKLRRTLRRKRVVTRLSIRARDAAGNQRLATRRIVVRRR